jgi:excisionase family DNA binding protein
MARKLMTIEEAAQQLGVTLEKINEMRERGEIHAYRDGGTWKFREDEVERVQRDLGDEVADFALDEDTGSVLGSESRAGVSGLSTAMGKPSGTGSAISDLDLAIDENPLAPGSGVGASGSGKSSDIGAMFDDLDTFDVDLASGVKKGSGKASDSGKAAGSDLGLGSALDLDTTPSGLDLESGAGSALDLTSENEDLVLGERADSDITRDPGTSGISLANPDQSGLSLEDDAVDVQLGGSAVDSFELGEDDAVAPTDSGPLKADDDFLLEPLVTDDDEAESGSQVIALADDDEEFETAGVAGAALVADEDEPRVARPGAAAAAAFAAEPEAPYTAWNVAGLACCVVLLLFCGMFAYDLLRNMWSWDQPYSVNSGMMETVAGWMGWKFK